MQALKGFGKKTQDKILAGIDLAARRVVDGDFVLAMADHLFEARALGRLLDEGPEPHGVALAVDRKLDTVFDLEEATKAQLSGTRVTRVGKELAQFEAVDTGLFYAGPPLFGALDRSVAVGRTTLSDGVNVLAAEGHVRAVDVGDCRWLDVDTPEELRQAERIVSRNGSS